jgi:hypothetical protein
VILLKTFPGFVSELAAILRTQISTNHKCTRRARWVEQSHVHFHETIELSHAGFPFAVTGIREQAGWGGVPEREVVWLQGREVAWLQEREVVWLHEREVVA